MRRIVFRHLLSAYCLVEKEVSSERQNSAPVSTNPAFRPSIKGETVQVGYLP